MNGNSLAWSPAHLQHSPGGQHVSHLSPQGITGQQMSYGCGPESMAMYELSQMDIKPDINQLQAHQQHLSNISPGLDTVGRIYDYSPYQHAQMIGGSIHSPMSAIGAQESAIPLYIKVQST
ncbi:hypothetical protein EB796_020110 [Bugula neritina]|uniref:Uncharacterized protein n=1 Tax=Bugula neritina TaxID=10212 RepID=A0A7J7J7P0_BUGNE|nr:hypothetical protein EB796_020110 [Bugula neritina]